MRFSGLAGALVAFTASAVAAAPPPPPLTSHVAAYEMTLEATRGQTDIADVRGLLVFDWTIACDAYFVAQRAELVFYYQSGGSQSVGWTFETEEAFDQSEYLFEMRRSAQGAEIETVIGQAAVAEGGGAAAFEAPDDADTERLSPDVLFPSNHTRMLVEAAAAGRKLVTAPVFVGDAAEGPSLLSAVIGPPIDPPTDGLDLARRPAWPIRIAFFPPDGEPDAGPEHEQDLVMQEDGVVRSLLLDYGDYVLKAELTRITANDRPAC